MHACGCLSPPVPPPIPTPDQVDFAVNQQAELIIFEVEQGADPHVTAHVLIKYAGDPEKFAWLIPVPSVPELSLSHTGAFGLIDEQTRPLVNINTRDVCPQQQWTCRTHPPPNCATHNNARSAGTGASDGYYAGGQASGADFGTGGAGGGSFAPPPVTVHARESVGDYETVTIGAGDGDAAVRWLTDEGFIVNASMGKYMQPYLDAGMLFLASKLVPSADVDELRPLRMRYAGDTPAIPLQLTAVAAEPNLTVTAFIYANEAYEPYGHPIVEVGEGDIGSPDGRSHNYPAVLSRLADSVGGDGFVLEYYGTPPQYVDPNPSCCSAVQNDVSADFCGVGDNGRCECPLRDFDALDCGGESGPAAEIGLVAELAANYARVTRLSTRLSPEEMSFDPIFRPMQGEEPVQGIRRFTGTHTTLASCGTDILDGQAYSKVVATQACASTYCGVEGRCAGTAQGAGCACSNTELARVFTDLDGTQSVTCVPQFGTVDLSAGGLELPDACAGTSLSDGAQCSDIGGFPAVLCPAGQAAVSTGADVPTCLAIVAETDGPGARNYTLEVDALEVCAPAPPSCPPHGWLQPVAVQLPGIQCDSSIPDPSWLNAPPPPTCETYSTAPMDTLAPRRELSQVGLCGCRTVGASPGRAPLGGLSALSLMLALALRRRRRSSP